MADVAPKELKNVENLAVNAERRAEQADAQIRRLESVKSDDSTIETLKRKIIAILKKIKAALVKLKNDAVRFLKTAYAKLKAGTEKAVAWVKQTAKEIYAKLKAAYTHLVEALKKAYATAKAKIYAAVHANPENVEVLKGYEGIKKQTKDLANVVAGKINTIK